MEQSPTPPAASGPALAPVHPRRWTPQRQQAFLLALEATRSVAAAAAHAGMSRQSAYRLLHRRPGSAFARAWALALSWRNFPALDMGRVTPGDSG